MKSTHKEEYRRLLEWLSAKRLHGGLSQKALADRLGKPQSYISKFESGERRLDIIELLDICEALDADPLEIIGKLLSERKS